MDELRAKLEEKNKTIEKKTGAALHATQEKNRISNELNDLRDQIDIKDRKVNVLQRKVGPKSIRASAKRKLQSIRANLALKNAANARAPYRGCRGSTGFWKL